MAFARARGLSGELLVKKLLSETESSMKKEIQVFPCPSQPVTIVAALFGRGSSQIAKVEQM